MPQTNGGAQSHGRSSVYVLRETSRAFLGDSLLVAGKVRPLVVSQKPGDPAQSRSNDVEGTPFSCPLLGFFLLLFSALWPRMQGARFSSSDKGTCLLDAILHYNLRRLTFTQVFFSNAAASTFPPIFFPARCFCSACPVHHTKETS